MVKFSTTATLMDGEDERLHLEAKSPSSEASPKAGPMATQTTSGNSIFQVGTGLQESCQTSEILSCISYSNSSRLSSCSKLELEMEILQTESSNFL